MSESVIIALFDMIVKLLPSTVSFLEDLVGNGNITPEHVPQILSHMADVSKVATDLPISSADITHIDDSVQPVANESHSP